MVRHHLALVVPLDQPFVDLLKEIDRIAILHPRRIQLGGPRLQGVPQDIPTATRAASAGAACPYDHGRRQDGDSEHAAHLVTIESVSYTHCGNQTRVSFQPNTERSQSSTTRLDFLSTQIPALLPYAR